MADATGAPPQDPFMAAAEGHVPLSSNAGSAATWFPSAETPPRPDRDYTTLRWLSVLGGLGFNDFYLRSPITGLLKLLIMGGIALIAGPFGALAAVVFTGLWEYLHVTTEKERVVNYGISAPFDLWHGVGQGMVTDQPTNYHQNYSYTAWQLTALFSFLGIDGIATGKPGVLIRKFIDFAFFCGYIVGLVYLIKAPNSVGRIVGLVFVGLLLAILAPFVIGPYFYTLRAALSNPNDVMSGAVGTGIKEDSTLWRLYNYYTVWAGWNGESTKKGIVHDIGLGEAKPGEMKKKYEIKYETPKMRKTAAIAAQAETQSTAPALPNIPGLESAKAASSSTFALSLLLGTFPLGLITILVSNLVPSPLPIVSFGTFFDVMYRFAALSRGEEISTADLLRGIPGASELAGMTEAMQGATRLGRAGIQARQQAEGAVVRAGELVDSGTTAAIAGTRRFGEDVRTASGHVGSAIGSVAGRLGSEIVGATQIVGAAARRAVSPAPRGRQRGGPPPDDEEGQELATVAAAPAAARAAAVVPEPAPAPAPAAARAAAVVPEPAPAPASAAPGERRVMQPVSSAGARKIELTPLPQRRNMGLAAAMGLAGSPFEGGLFGTAPPTTHRGGARAEPDAPLSTEAIALGATVAALIAGGAIKLAVDSLVTQ
jgi:hypothetical protein